MSHRIVVTGLGTVSPCGNRVDQTWDNIRNGRSGIATITKFDASTYTTQIAGEVKGFDPADFIDKKEIKKMDVFIHYALAATKEAMEDAKLTISEDFAEEVGVSIGVGIGGLPNIEYYAGVLKERGPSKITPFFIPMTISNMASGYVSIEFGAKGYNATTTSACSSANHSIGDAARIIERGDAKVMIVGGTESTICGMAIGGFGAMKALSRRNDSPETASRPYDQGRDGFVLAEGCGILILEEYEFAKARGAKMYGELVGYGFSSDAYHITSPTTDGPARAMKMALKDAKLDPSEVDYINAHGTSTPAGDINELKAIKLTLGEENAKKVSISSSKSMTGHLLGAAGGLEAVITLKAMQEGIVPPTINLESPDPECDLDVTPNHAKKREIKVAMSNSFGFGGTNATLVFRKI
ncbi:MAG: beta-ketoacyl-[acyl-carrier-protein] synthase II [Candidatus Lambdaproteobacteria bacterium RIFOXYD2_FULL_50_16]|uniref:3-oxoacyl-[acyl-carrier-protein] synthase 2 n=1 Tax=Candidatus Lambdaproteobacteria bacterium RIFOXYD2_FULL_50_16 TaxID=1817772 RepID=A0A1F6G5B3_9PROT|nr:MAG: beta-ketoacyl-[acyl-carrier-protein] synthase II [Candidatus Lambdaproteobacteria bacterium RIFOXYD2_FULL_50_16]